MEPLRIGLVGINGFAQTHLHGIRHLVQINRAKWKGSVILPAEQDSERDNKFRQEGVSIYDSLKAMLEDSSNPLDLITLPIGIHQHAPMSIQIMKAGYHVLCEKPVAGTLQETRAMQACQKQTGKTLTIGYQHIFSPLIQRLKAETLNHTWGALKEMRAYVIWPRDTHYYKRNSWAGKIKVGDHTIYDSPLQNATAHYLNVMLYLAGSTSHDSAIPRWIYGENYRAKPIESADTQYLRLETNEGVYIQFITTHAASEVVEPVFEFTYEQARIRLVLSGENRVERYKLGNQASEPVETWVNESPIDLTANLFEQVASAIQSNQPALCTIHNAWQHTLCVEKTFKNNPVVTIPKEFLDMRVGNEGAEHVYIRDIKPLFKKMHDSRASFHECGVPWAIAGIEDRMVLNE
jgi:predicted dehydrogenase